MDLFKYKAVNNYLDICLKKLYNDHGIYMTYPSEMSKRFGLGKFVPFKIHKVKNHVEYREWVKQRLNICYDHASTILLGLKKNDKCVIGYGRCGLLAYKKGQQYYHAWNEFEYNGEWFVYDNQNDKIYEKEYYYSIIQPKIIEVWTLEDVLKFYDPIKQKYAEQQIIYIKSNYENKGRKIKTDCEMDMHQFYVGNKIKLDRDGEIESVDTYLPGC